MRPNATLNVDILLYDVLGVTFSAARERAV
jgi:hypothetical protein